MIVQNEIPEKPEIPKIPWNPWNYEPPPHVYHGRPRFIQFLVLQEFAMSGSSVKFTQC